MNKHFTISLRLCLSLLLVVGPLMSSLSARHEVSTSIKRMESRRPSVPKRHSISKKDESKARIQQDVAKVVTGRSSTLLADGRLLMVGGEGDLMASASIVDSKTGESITLGSKLLHPRMGHSATMLPDGNVLIFGGIGPEGRYVDSAEIFNPELQRFEPRTVKGLSLRANHTATLLTDGQLLIGGGTDEKGAPTTKVELWDIRKNSATVLRSRLNTDRQNHTAALQADGTVIFSGGTGANGEARQDDEIYEPESQSLTPTTKRAARENNNAPHLEFSAPAAGAMEVDENTQVVLRFSKPLSVKTLNKTNVVLQGPLGEVATRVVPAESGMLAFITPLAPLHGNSQYNLTVNGASDESNREFPFVAISFKTKQCANGQSNCDASSQPNDLDTWIPNEKNFKGDWRSGRPDSQTRSLPVLQAPEGETALAGQVLSLSGTPLANVTLQIDERTATTDFTGRFLLRGLESGRKVLTIQGHTASRPGKTYGTFDVLVDVTAGKTTVLSYTIWLPVLDEQNAARLTVPTAREVSVTTPRVPGMEVRIPSAAVLRMPAGKHHTHGMTRRELTSVAITPIPIDRPPFPLPPGAEDGLLFTLQLHGAKVEGLNGEKRPGMRIIFPNYAQLPAGRRVTFWNYESEANGWYVYGQGTVSPDRSQVIPDPGVELQSMHCASYMDTGPQPKGPTAGNGSSDGDPVDLGTGMFILNKFDLVLPDVIPIALSRTYRPGDTVTRSFGKGMTSQYDMYIWGHPSSFGDLVLPDGGRIHFDRTHPTAYEFECTNSPTPFYKATMRMISGIGPTGAWEVKLTDGTIYQFGIKAISGDIFGVHVSINGLSAVQDRFGNRLIITRDNDFRVTKVTSPNGRWIQFAYSDSTKRVATATDNMGRVVSYTYDAGGRLWKVTDAKGGITEYTYDSSDRMLTIKDPRGIVYLTNEYDANGRVSRQTLADTGVYQFAYTLDAAGKVTQTDVTNPRGFLRRATFNSLGYTVTDSLAVGTPQQQTYTYERQAGTNLIVSLTDPLGRKSSVTYDTKGNITSLTRLADTANAVTTNFTYEPVFNQVATATDPLSHTVTYAYNVRGNLASVTDALGNKVTFKYNAAAELTSVIDALGNTSNFTRSLGLVTEFIDPLGHARRNKIDGGGRITRQTSALGRVVEYEHDNLNQRTRIKNALQGETILAYDGNGNLTSLTDAKNNVTSYTYDNMDRIVTRRDPLLRDETFEYDLNGNLKKVTDRKNQVTNFTYDSLDRLTQVSHADGSTITYTYDLADRVTQVNDSISGVVTYTYDGLSRLLSETTPQGSISYTYDAAGRRITMTITGQPVINYTYDNADRLTQISQGSSTVTYTYDAAYRRTSVTFPNGVVTEYGYNAASQLTSITYKLGTNVLGNLTYDYDADGRRSRMGGSFARNVLPQVITTATYNAANHQLTFGGNTLTYDLNGNLTSDGTNTYTWDSRDRLSSINGAGLTATFTYDSSGRRISKNINGVTSQFLYDGENIVQEQSVQLGNANILNGGLDEVLTRVDAAGPWSPLRDGLGSLLALTDGSGAVQTEYTYGAFGQPATNGTQSNNSHQYTGRENDGTGLQFNRARYYHPTLQRFISEDPIGFGGGQINLYSYVANSPTNYNDPRGRDIAVIENGPTDGNPFGHTAIAITGYGVYSYGNGNGGDGSNIINDSLREYIAREAPRRRTVIWVIKTTPEQDARAAALGRQMDHYPKLTRGRIVFENCSTRAHDLLDAAGIPEPPDGLPRFWPGTGGGRAFRNGANGYELPKGSTVIIPWDPNSPYDFDQFELKIHGRK